jgi:Mg2+ and Co2+ transporter CorA
MQQFQSRQTDYLNTLVNRLTFVTIILSTATVITGFYGMNVGGFYLNGNNSNGALTVFAVLVLLAIIQIVMLRSLLSNYLHFTCPCFHDLECLFDWTAHTAVLLGL